jgi:arylsulfatase
MAGNDAKPNIIIILADDMGFSDIGCFGAEIRTPNLDAMAAGGMRFTRMYNGARCCPTRASLLTGLHPHQTGVGWMVGDLGHPNYQGYLNERCVTIAEVLRPVGYRTLLAGKWHVGGHYAIDRPDTWRPGSERMPLPIQRGFDRHWGMLGGATSYFDPHSVADQDRIVRVEGEYFTDSITSRALDMIDAAHKDQTPFFLYLGYTAPHWPLHALPEDIARYEDAYRDGWDAVRTARHERLKAMGILDPRWPISPRDPQAPAWDDLPRERRQWESMRMAVYAAQIDRMDQGIGRVMARLRQHGIDDNTLVIFLSDNGGCAEFLREDGAWGSSPAATHTGKPIRCGNIPGLLPGPADTFMSYDTPWANASNTPFRLYKHWVHEGGISAPCVVYWPAAMRGRCEGAICHAPAHITDITATCIDAAGARYPDSRNGTAAPALAGESFAQALRGGKWRRSGHIFIEHEGNRAVHQGQWKLVSRHPGAWELYDMSADRTELCDLANAKPDMARELAGAYEQWAQTTGVEPWDRIRPR